MHVPIQHEGEAHAESNVPVQPDPGPKKGQSQFGSCPLTDQPPLSPGNPETIDVPSILVAWAECPSQLQMGASQTAAQPALVSFVARSGVYRTSGEVSSIVTF